MGAHFTSEADIQRIVGLTIVHPWTERIDKAKTMKGLTDLRRELAAFRVLDPACGSGNFLYVAFREIARLDLLILSRLEAIVSRKEFVAQTKQISIATPKQFFGIDNDSFGVELAKVSLMIAKKLARDEVMATLARAQEELALHDDDALPLDNLDDNISCADALFSSGPTLRQ
jgi:type I restriction-modification system DNA methylase subunit